MYDSECFDANNQQILVKLGVSGVMGVYHRTIIFQMFKNVF